MLAYRSKLRSRFAKKLKTGEESWVYGCDIETKAYTKLNTVSLNRRALKNTTNLFICQKQADNPTYIKDMCTNMTEKNAKIELTKFVHI